MTEFPLHPYSDGMISEFHELSDKINQLAALTQSLRRENAQLRRSNAVLSADNLAYMDRLGQAQARLEALLAKLPAPASVAVANVATGTASASAAASAGVTSVGVCADPSVHHKAAQ